MPPLHGAGPPALLAAAFAAALGLAAMPARAQEQSEAVAYLKLTTPRRVLCDAQAWEGGQFPHTMSVLELQRDGYRYWGWYGLDGARGIGLARSNDLVNWIKYPRNPLLFGARWPSALKRGGSRDPETIYFAFDRIDAFGSSIVLGKSADGIHITTIKTLVRPAPRHSAQNPNLFRDPVSRRYYLTYYRGNNKDKFEIVSRNAQRVADLDQAPEDVIIRSTETVAAPTLLYVPRPRPGRGIYYLATEVYPARYGSNRGEWQVKVFVSDALDRDFKAVAGNPVMRGQRACLFQHVFNGRFYGFACHIETKDQADDAKDMWALEEVEAPLEDVPVAPDNGGASR